MTPSQKLAKIARIYETIRSGVSSHAHYNLEGAIYDIEHTGKCDRVSLRTLKRVSKQLADIGSVLETNQ